MAYNYIIASDDYLSMQNKVDEIKNSLPNDYDIVNYDLAEDNFYSLIDEFNTISLFDNPKFVVLKSCEKLIAMDKKCGVNADSLKELFKSMNNNESQNVLIFVFLDNADYKNDVFETLKRYSTFIDIKFKNVKKDEFLLKYLAENNFQIKDDAKDLLLSYNQDLLALRTSLDILVCYKAEDKIISTEDVKKMVIPPLDDNIYELIVYVISDNKPRIFACLKDIKVHNLDSSGIIGMLINKFQEMHNVSILLKAKLSSDDIANIFNVKPGRAYYMVKNAKSTPLEVIDANLKRLNNLEYDIRSGKIDPNLGLELYLLK